MAGISRAEKDLLAIINEDPSILDQIPQSRLEELLILLYNKINNDSSHTITVDSELSDTSENPIQNKAVKAAITQILTSLDLKTQISNDPSNIITKKIDGIFAEEPFITVPTQTDASLDATAAVQTALTKALLTGKNLFFPKGIYTISERLIIPKSIKVFGASREDTVIKFTGTAKETTPYNPQYYDESNAAILIQANGVEIADLTIEGGTSNTDTSDCYGIAMHRILTKNDKTNYEGSERVALTNVEIRYFKTGLFMFGGWNRYITRCYFRDNAEYGVKYYPLEADSIGNWAGSGDVYIACQFVANLFAGFYAKGLFETTIWNSIFEYNKRAIEVDSCTDICFKNCWNEANIENLKVTGNCKFEGGYNINHRTVDHIVVGGNDLVIFENETLITMYRAGNVVFSQTAGIITKGVEIGVEVDNLLANPGFSEVSGGTGTIPSDAGWYHEGTFEIIEDNPNYVSLSNEGAETDVYRGMWATQEIALSGNTKYNIAAWIKTPDRSAIDSTGIMFYISWKTADGVTILNDNRTIILTADNTWEYHELQIEAPKGAALLKVGYGLTRNGHVYFREPEVSVVGSISSSNIYVRKDNSDSNIIKFVDINGNELGSINLSTNASEPETDVINWEEN